MTLGQLFEEGLTGIVYLRTKGARGASADLYATDLAAIALS